MRIKSQDIGRLESGVGLKRCMQWVTLALMLFVSAACGAAEVSEGPGEPISEAPTEDMTPHLVWLSPEDGAEVSSPVHLEFEAVNYDIAPVPEGEVEMPREGIAHHHVGTAGECLEPGTMIPRDNPEWIHLGDGSNFIDMQLEPGEYTFTIQAGNDLHEAVAGLCEMITFTVTE
jgi:hypothetical protein